MLSAVHPCINLVLITIFKMCCYVSDIIINTYNSCDDDDDGCRYNTNYRTIRSRIARWCLDNLKLWRPSKSSMMRWWWYWWWWFLTLRCAVTASDIIIMISWFADMLSSNSKSSSPQAYALSLLKLPDTWNRWASYTSIHLGHQ